MLMLPPSPAKTPLSCRATSYLHRHRHVIKQNQDETPFQVLARRWGGAGARDELAHEAAIGPHDRALRMDEGEGGEEAHAEDVTINHIGKEVGV